MKKLLAALSALVLLVSPAHGMGSKPSNNTGDRKLDNTLEKISFEANDDPDGFVGLLGSSLGIPEQDIRQAMGSFGLATPDIYMASALAKATGRPVRDVAEEYSKNPGKGWGVLAKDLGIKPGSSEFKQLKDGAHGFLGDLEARADARREHERQMQKEKDKEQKKEKEQKTKPESQGKGHGTP